jgi:hypothetical protein
LAKYTCCKQCWNMVLSTHSWIALWSKRSTMQFIIHIVYIGNALTILNFEINGNLACENEIIALWKVQRKHLAHLSPLSNLASEAQWIFEWKETFSKMTMCKTVVRLRQSYHKSRWLIWNKTVDKNVITNELY